MERLQIAKAHAKNKKKIKKAFIQINRSLNQAIKENKTDLEETNVRMLIILYASYLEPALGYITHIYEKQITNKIKNDVLSKRSEIDKWLELIDVLFRKHYLNGTYKELNLLNLGHTNYHRYRYIKELCDTDIRTIIEIRNKLAHGQWSIALNSDDFQKNQSVTTKIWTLTKKDTLIFKRIIISFVDIMELLAASGQQLAKDFDKKVHNLELKKIELENRYNWLISNIKSKKIDVSGL